MELDHAKIADYLLREQENNPLITAIDMHITRAFESVRQSEIHTPEGQLTATFLQASAAIMRPLFADPDFPRSDLAKPMGGPSHNPHSPIDMIGGLIADRVMQKFPDMPQMLIRIEERGVWETTKPIHPSVHKNKPPTRFIIIDPCDMTSQIQTDATVQSTGIAIYDIKGTLLAGGIIGLSRNTQIIVEKEPRKSSYSMYGTNSEPSPNTRAIAYLNRRLTDGTTIPQLIRDLTQKDIFPSVSGSAVLELLDGTIDLIADPKGQPWYELAIWGSIAKTLGYEVQFPDGKPIDFSAVLLWGASFNDDMRIPMIMAKDQSTIDRYRKSLTPKASLHHAANRILDIFSRIKGNGPISAPFIAKLTGSAPSTVISKAQENRGCMHSVSAVAQSVDVRADATFVFGGTGMEVHRNDGLASFGPKGSGKRSKIDRGTQNFIKHSGGSH